MFRLCSCGSIYVCVVVLLVWLSDRNSININKSGFRMFEIRFLIGIFETKREEVPGGWRKMQNKGLLDLYCYL
jgi:hypothetical protein